MKRKKLKCLTIIMLSFLTAYAEQKVSSLQSGQWKAQNNIYVVEGDITIPKGLVLSIDPGVTVKFNGDYSFTADGELFINGSKDSMVIFTSAADDKTGGDTNKDGIETGPSPLDWSGIRISNPDSKSSIRNLSVMYSANPLISASNSISIDSLTLRGNSRNRVIIGADSITIAENYPYGRKPSIAGPAAGGPVQTADETAPWYVKPKFIIGSTVSAACAIIIYSAWNSRKPADNPSDANIPDPPGPPQ